VSATDVPGFFSVPAEGYIAFSVPAPNGTMVLVRIKSQEAFRDFLVASIGAASEVWPDIGDIWREFRKDRS
jgi:hypothetical protein